MSKNDFSFCFSLCTADRSDASFCFKFTLYFIFMFSVYKSQYSKKQIFDVGVGFKVEMYSACKVNHFNMGEYMIVFQ